MRVFAIAALLLAASACTKPGEAEAPEAPEQAAVEPFLGEAVLGNKNAPVEIVEYASTTCSHCAAFHAQVFPQLKSAYLDTGKAKLVYKSLPTQPVELSIAGIAIARCAGEQKFFAVIGELFEEQEAIFDAARESGPALQNALTDIGSHHGLTPDQVRLCVQNPAVETYVINALQDMPTTVDGTPTLFVNGEKVENPTFENLSKAIDAAS